MKIDPLTKEVFPGVPVSKETHTFSAGDVVEILEDAIDDFIGTIRAGSRVVIIDYGSPQYYDVTPVEFASASYLRPIVRVSGAILRPPTPEQLTKEGLCR